VYDIISRSRYPCIACGVVNPVRAGKGKHDVDVVL
jgi:hypothetical protein